MNQCADLFEVSDMVEAELSAHFIHETRRGESYSSYVTGRVIWHEDGRIFGKVNESSGGKSRPILIAGLRLNDEGILKFLTYNQLQDRSEIAIIGRGSAESFCQTEEGWEAKYGGVFTLDNIYRRELPKELDLGMCPERGELERLLSPKTLFEMKDVAYSNGRTCILGFQVDDSVWGNLRE